MSTEAPFDNPGADALRLENQLCFPLYACARRVVSLYTPYLKPLGITYTQYLVLMALWEQDSQSVGALCRLLLLDSGTLTPLLKKMEASGLIRRERSRADERIVIITLTEAGRALRGPCASIPAQVGRCVPLDPEEAATLYRLLYKTLGGISES